MSRYERKVNNPSRCEQVYGLHQEDERAESVSEGPAGPDTAGSAEKWAGIYPTGAYFQYEAASVSCWDVGGIAIALAVTGLQGKVVHVGHHCESAWAAVVGEVGTKAWALC